MRQSNSDNKWVYDPIDKRQKTVTIIKKIILKHISTTQTQKQKKYNLNFDEVSK